MWWCLCSVVPGMSGCPVIPMGGIPRLFMAVAQALGSDMGIVIELESIAMLQIPSAERYKKIYKYNIRIPGHAGWGRGLFLKRVVLSRHLQTPSLWKSSLWVAVLSQRRREWRPPWPWSQSETTVISITLSFETTQPDVTSLASLCLIDLHSEATGEAVQLNEPSQKCWILLTR